MNVTEAARDTGEKAAGAAGPLAGLAHGPAADRLKSEVQDYLSAQAQNLLTGFGRRLGRGTALLNELAEGDSSGLARIATDAGRKIDEGKSPMRTAVELGGGLLKDRVTDAVKGLAGGGKGKGGKRRSGAKATVVMESVDVGVPLRTAYDQWTQYQEFSSFTKGVRSAQPVDDTTSDWKAKVFWSNRSWKASTTEQVPDDRIAWTSEGAKGTTKGVVSFHELATNLTRVVLVLEYYPQGLFERTGNIWRAQGRRARLDLKHFARYITIRGEATDGWRGEIRDGEVVQSHEDALAEDEPRDEASQSADEASGGDEDGAEPESHDEYEYEANAGYEEAVPEDDEPSGEAGARPEDEYDDGGYPEEEASEAAEYPEEAENGYADAEADEYEDADEDEYADADEDAYDDEDEAEADVAARDADDAEGRGRGRR